MARDEHGHQVVAQLLVGGILAAQVHKDTEQARILHLQSEADDPQPTGRRTHVGEQAGLARPHSTPTSQAVCRSLEEGMA